MDKPVEQYTLEEIARAINRPAEPPAEVQVDPLDAVESELIRVVDTLYEQTGHGVSLLEELVEINSFSDNQDGITRVGERIRSLMEPLDFRTTIHQAEKMDDARWRGPHYVFEHPGSGGRILMIGHLDTVFHPESGFDTFVARAGRAFGPGAADMKGGLVVMIDALTAMHQHGLLAGRDITVVMNGDEEVGSLNSRPLLESLSRRADRGLEFEPGRTEPWGSIIVARKGLGQFRITVYGRKAHAGNRPFDGVSAVHDLAAKVLKILELNDMAAGTTINAGIFRTAHDATRNTIPDFARAELDLRYWDPDEGPRIVDAVREIVETPVVRNPWTGETTRTELWSNLHRPAMDQTPELHRWASEIVAYAGLVNAPIGLTTVGGGSDANIAASAGLMTLAGFGPVGSNFHTHDEWVDLPSITDRTRLAAIVLNRCRVMRGQRSDAEDG